MFIRSRNCPREVKRYEVGNLPVSQQYSSGSQTKRLLKNRGKTWCRTENLQSVGAIASIARRETLRLECCYSFNVGSLRSTYLDTKSTNLGLGLLGGPSRDDRPRGSCQASAWDLELRVLPIVLAPSPPNACTERTRRV